MRVSGYTARDQEPGKAASRGLEVECNSDETGVWFEVGYLISKL